MKNIKGKTMNEMMKMEASERMKPSIYISSDDMPEINNWEVGKMYDLKVRVCMDSKSEDGSSINACLCLEAYEDLTDYNDDPSTPKFSTDGGYMLKK
jgi:hypothetical protein